MYLYFIQYISSINRHYLLFRSFQCPSRNRTARNAAKSLDPHAAGPSRRAKRITIFSIRLVIKVRQSLAVALPTDTPRASAATMSAIAGLYRRGISTNARSSRPSKGLRPSPRWIRTRFVILVLIFVWVREG